MRATDILKFARQQITDFIVFEIKNIYLFLNKEIPNEEEDYIVEISGLTIKVEVDNSYLDVEETTLENRSINEIHLTTDNEIYLVSEYDDDEIELKEISIEELVGLSNILENIYLKLVK